MWKVPHRKYKMLWKVDWRVFSEHYVEGTAQQVDSGIAA